MQLSLLLTSGLAGIFVTWGCIYLMKPVAVQIGLVDMPGGRKTHASQVPLIGGVAIFIGYCFSLLCLNISLSTYRGLLAGCGILVVIGVIDDFRELKPRVRLFGQILAVLLLIAWGHLSVMHLGNLFFFGYINLGIWSYIITVLSVLLFINAINMIDGLDGLSGLVILGQCFLLALLSFYFGQRFDGYLLTLLMMPLCVYLAFNFPFPWQKQVCIFMGDAGSTFLGFVLAWFAVGLSQTMLSTHYHVPGFNLVTILWVLAYPLFDLLTVVIYRVRTGRSPILPSRDHFHHILLDKGMRPITATLTLFIFSFSLGAVGLLMAYWQVPEAWQLIQFLIVFMLCILVSRRMRVKIKSQPVRLST